MKQIKNSISTKGFTLIEALIAIFILLVGILGAVTMQWSAIRGNSFARELTEATNLLQDHAEDILSWKFDDPRLTNTQNIDEGHYSVDYTITPDSPTSESMIIKIDVHWEGQKDYSATTTFIKTQY